MATPTPQPQPQPATTFDVLQAYRTLASGLRDAAVLMPKVLHPESAKELAKDLEYLRIYLEVAVLNAKRLQAMNTAVHMTTAPVIPMTTPKETV